MAHTFHYSVYRQCGYRGH